MKNKIKFCVDKPSLDDIGVIYNLINLGQYEEKSLFFRSQNDIHRNISSFFVARDNNGQVIGCISVYKHNKHMGEIRNVLVEKKHRGLGIGKSLIQEAILMCRREFKLSVIWLDTQKPTYFARYGFQACSRWMMPKQILLTKVIWVFQQSPSKWYSSFTGSFTPMYLQLT